MPTLRLAPRKRVRSKSRRRGFRIGRKRGQSVIGVDIGSRVVKIVALNTRAAAPRVAVVASGALPPDAIGDGEIVDPGAVVATLRTLAQRESLPTKRVATAVSGRSIIARSIWMDQVADDDILQAVEWEAEQHIPFDLNEVYLDHEILRIDEAERRLQVLIVAAKRDAVDQLAAMVSEAGLYPSVVDVDALAAHNAVLAREPLASGELVALVEIGAEFSNVVVANADGPLLTSSIAFGTSRLVDGVLKRSPSPRAEVEASLAAPNPSGELNESVAAAAEELSVGLERSLSYLDSRTLGEPAALARIVLCGGGACVPSLVSFLRRRHRLPVEVGDPLAWMDTSAIDGRGSIRNSSPMLAVGVGLALRQTED